MRPRQTDSDRDLTNTDLRARRLQGARRGTLGSDQEAPLVAPTDPSQAERWRGPKLTKAQRDALITAVALHEDSPPDTIREVFADLCEDDVPTIADRTIRYYRARVRSDLTVQAEAARDQALLTGLANKGSRVAELRRQFAKLTRLEAGQQPTQILVLLAKEKRETLKQIALELGQLSSGAPITINAAAVATAEAQLVAENDQAKQEVEVFLAGVIEREVATVLALAAAQRPADRALPD
jgi:hypothetical protein